MKSSKTPSLFFYTREFSRVFALRAFLLVGVSFFLLISTSAYGQVSKEITFAKSLLQDKTDTLYFCADPATFKIQFNSDNYRSKGETYWVNTKGTLIDPNQAVESGDYRPDLKRQRADAVYPLAGFAASPTLTRKVRTDHNEYRFKLVQLNTPNNFEKEIIFRHYPALPTDKTIGDYITTSSTDTISACVERARVNDLGIAAFELPKDKVDASMDARIRWSFDGGDGDNGEILQPTFSPQDARQIQYSIANIRPFSELKDVVNNEKIYKLRIQLERPVDGSSVDGTCAKTDYKIIVVKLFERPEPPNLVTEDTIWYCADAPFQVPIQIDKNYPPQFTPQWEFYATQSDPGFGNGIDSRYPRIADPSNPGTYLEGVDKGSNLGKTKADFGKYVLSVRLYNPLCATDRTDLVVMVGDRASDARLYEDTVYSCGLSFVSQIGFSNVGVAAGTVGRSFFTKLSGPESYSFTKTSKAPPSEDTGLLRIDNLAVPEFTGQINNYVFLLNTQNRGCPIQSNQRDTLSVSIVSQISKPVLTNATRMDVNDYVKDVYISGIQDAVPLLFRDETPFVFEWKYSTTNPSVLSHIVSKSDKNRFLVTGFQPPASGSTSYAVDLATIYEPSVCRSDDRKIIVNVTQGFPIYTEKVITKEQIFYNQDMLDTLTICTNGDTLSIKPKKPSLAGYTLKVKTIDRQGGMMNNFSSTTQSDATGSDTSIDLKFDPLQQGTTYFVTINYSLFKGTQEIQKDRIFVLKLSGSVNTNPIPDTLTHVYLCAKPIFTLGGKSVDPGIWKQIDGNQVTITNPNNFNTTITKLVRPVRDLDYIRYAFQWKSDNGFCPAVYDTQYVTNLPVLSVPAIGKITRLDASNAELYTRVGASDTVCLSSEPGTPSTNYRIVASKADVGIAKWVFNHALSHNVKTLPTFSSDVFSDSLLVNVAFPPPAADSVDIIYVFERQVYHPFPIGCDTIKQYAYIIIEKNTFPPRLIDGRRLLYICPDDNKFTLEAVPTGKSVRWRITPDFIKDRFGYVAGNAQEISPVLTESLKPTFVGFAYHALENAQTRLSLASNDSFFAYIEMTMVQNYCSFRKDTLELRFLNKPSTAAFDLPAPLRLCKNKSNTPNDTLTDQDIIKALQDTSTAINIGYRFYNKLFSGPSAIAGIDSQVWEYRVAHGGCDTSKATKIVYIQKGADTAKILADTLYVCYDANGNSTATSFNVSARKLLPSSVGRWNMLNVGGNAIPTLSGISNTTLTVAGSALSANLAASANKQVMYQVEWTVLDACKNFTRDTIKVLHYGLVPRTTLNTATENLYACTDSSVASEVNIKMSPSVNKTWWSVSRFTPEQMDNGNLLPSNPTSYPQADTLKEGTNLGWGGKALIYKKPTFVQLNDTTTKVIFWAYPSYAASYELQQKVQNGEKCPAINEGSVIYVRGMDMQRPSLNIPGYNHNTDGAVILCPSTTTYNLNFSNVTSNVTTDLSVFARSKITKQYENIWTLDKQLVSTNGSATEMFNFSSMALQYEVTPFSVDISTTNVHVPSPQLTTENGCLVRQSLQFYLYDAMSISSIANATSLGSVKTASFQYCKGSEVKDSVRVDNPLGTKFILWKRAYHSTYQFWKPWEAVDSSINQALFRGFKIGKLEEDSVQYRVSARFNTIDNQGTCKQSLHLPVAQSDTLLPGVVTVGTYDNTSHPLVGTLSINGNQTNQASVCWNAKEESILALADIANATFVQPVVYKWQQGVGSTSLGEIVWQDIYGTNGLPSINVSSLNQPTYFRALFETNDGTGCYAYSPTAHIDLLKGASSGCVNIYPQPGLSTTGSKATMRYQFFGEQPQCVITGFNFDVPFQWNMLKSFSRTGIAASGNTTNKIEFTANKNNTTDVISDTVIFTRVLNSGETATPQDTVVAYIDIVPLRRLNGNLDGGTYSSTSIAGGQVSITSLNPLVKYTWQTASSKPAVTGIASTGSGQGTLIFTTNSTEKTLRDTIIFIKNDPLNAIYNNSLDTVTLYITVLPEDKLAINDDTRFVTIVTRSGQSVTLDRFVPGVGFDWQTFESIQSGITTGTGKLGLANTGSNATRLTFTAADNTTDQIISDTVRFVNASGAKTAYLDTMFYYIQILPEQHLHSNSTRYINLSMLIRDSVNLEQYFNRSIPYNWLVTSSASISYRVYPLTTSSKLTGNSGISINDFRYFAPQSINTESISDTIRFTRNLGGDFNTTNSSSTDTLFFILTVYQPPHLNTAIGTTQVDTFTYSIFHGGNLSVTSPQISSGVNYQWQTLNTSGATRTTIPATRNTPIQGEFTGGNVSIVGATTTAVTDTFKVFRVGQYSSFNDNRDTVVLIVRVLPLPNLVRTSQAGINNSNKGYYTRSLDFLYPSSGFLSKEYGDLLNSGIGYRTYLASINASGKVITRTGATKIFINVYPADNTNTFSGDANLQIAVVSNNPDKGYKDTVLLVRASADARTSADSLVLFITVNDPYYLRPSYIPSYVKFQTDYAEKKLLIGNTYITPNVEFNISEIIPKYEPKIIPSSDWNSYAPPQFFKDSIKIKIAQNATARSRADSFYLTSVTGTSNAFDSLLVIIDQLPLNRLRRNGFSKVMYKTLYDASDRGSFLIQNQINPGVEFATSITGTGNATMGTSTRDSLRITPGASLFDNTIVLYRVSDPSVPHTPEDSLYVVLTHSSDDRLRKASYPQDKKLYIPQSASPSLVTIDDEINPYVPYTIAIDHLSVLDSVSYNGGLTYSKITTNTLPVTPMGMLRFKTKVNNTQTILSDVVRLSRAINTPANNSQDTFILNVELASTYCNPVSPFGLDTVRLQVREGQTFSLVPLLSSGAKGWKFNEDKTSRLFDGISGAESNSSALVDAPLSAKTTFISPSIDTLTVYSACNTIDKKILILTGVPTPACTEGITEGTITQQIIALEPNVTNLVLKFPKSDGSLQKISYIFDEKDVTGSNYGDAIDLNRTTPAPSDSIRYNTTKNDYPYTLYDTLKVFLTGPTRICSSVEVDTVQVIFATLSTIRLRPEKSSKYLNFEVYEGDTVSIVAGTHINASVPYQWKTQTGDGQIGTTGGSGSSSSTGGTFSFTAPTGITQERTETISFWRSFSPSGEELFGDFDSLIVAVKVKPSLRMTYSQATSIDSFVFDFDYTGGQIAKLKKQFRAGLSYTYKQLAVAGYGLPVIQGILPNTATLNTKDSFQVTIGQNTTDSVRKVVFELSLVGTTTNTYKNTVRVIINQSPKQDYLRKPNSPLVQYKYISGLSNLPITIQPEILQGVAFNFKISGANFLKVAGTRTGTNKMDSLTLEVTPANLTTSRMDTVTLYKAAVSSFNASRDSFILIVVQTPIVRLRKTGIEKIQYAPVSTSWEVSEPINSEVPFSARLLTNNNVVTGLTQNVNQTGQINQIIINSNNNLSNAAVVDTVLLFREGDVATLNDQDSLILVVYKPAFVRLRERTMSALLEFSYYGGEKLRIDDRYLNTSSGYGYTITTHGAVDPARTIMSATGSSSPFDITMGINTTNTPVSDTIDFVRQTNNVATLDVWDTLRVIVHLYPFRRLRKEASTQILNVEKTVQSQENLVIKEGLNLAVNFVRLNEFPQTTYRDSFVRVIDPNLGESDQMYSDTLVKQVGSFGINIASNLNALDTLIINTNVKPIARLRRKDVPRRLYLSLQSLDSLLVGKNFLTQGVPFRWIYTTAGVAKPPQDYHSPNSQDSIKFYAARNLSSTDQVATIQLVRNGNNINTQDTLTIYLRVSKQAGLHVSNAKSGFYTLRTGEYIKFQEFTANKYYTYKTKRYSSLMDRERVIDSNDANDRLTPLKVAANGIYIAKADTSLSFVRYDTIVFTNTDASGNAVQNADIPSSIDSFYLYVTLLPINLTDGQMYAKQQYRSLTTDNTYAKFLNEGIEFDWTTLSSPSEQTGFLTSGTGKDSTVFTTKLNTTRSPLVDVIRFVKKFGSDLSFRDTLTTEIILSPVPRLWDKDEIHYHFYSDKQVVLDSFFTNVPFTWTAKGTSGLDTTGSGANAVYFKTTTNATSQEIIDTAIFVKKADGEPRGVWDTLRVYIHLKPKVRLYNLATYPNQVAYMEACSEANLIFRGLEKGVTFRARSSSPTTLIVSNTGKDSIAFTAPTNSSADDRIDSIYLARSPLIDAYDALMGEDSLVIVVKTLGRPSPPELNGLNTAIVCPGINFRDAFQLIGVKHYMRGAELDNRYEIRWYRDTNLVGVGPNRPSIVFGVKDTLNISLLTVNLSCPHITSSALSYRFLSEDLPRINLKWATDWTGLEYRLEDTLVVCGANSVRFTNKSVKAQDMSGAPGAKQELSYTWTSPRLEGVTNSASSPEFTIDKIPVVSDKPSDTFPVQVVINANPTSVCFTKTINTALIVKRLPSIGFEIPDTICLPNLLYPENTSNTYGEHLIYKWSVDGFTDTVIGASPVMDLSRYTNALLDRPLTVTLSTTSTCGADVATSRTTRLLKKLRPAIQFDPAVSYLDTICISSANKDYFTSYYLNFQDPNYLFFPEDIEYAWFINDSLRGNGASLNTNLNTIIKDLSFTNDSIRFTVQTNKASCYADTIVPLTVIKGVIRPTDVPPISHEYYNYCPPARLSFTSNMINATKWAWYEDGRRISVLKLSENVRESVLKDNAQPDIVPADTNYLNNYILRNLGFTNMSLVVNNDFRLCAADSVTLPVKVYAYPEINAPNISVPPNSGNILCLPELVTFETIWKSRDTTVRQYFWSLNDEAFTQIIDDSKYTRFVTKEDKPEDGSIAINGYVIDVNNCKSLITTTPVDQQEEPEAHFFYKDVCLGDTFYAASTYFTISTLADSDKILEWDMGDGTTYTSLDIYDKANAVKHYFAREGVYVVRLIARYTNVNCGADTFIASVKVYAPIQVEVAAPNTVCVNTPVEFDVVTDNSLDTIQNYVWDFSKNPDLESSEKNPVRYFSNPGSFEVTLVATSKYCNIRDTVKQELVVSRPIRLGVTYDDIYALKNQSFGLYAEQGGLSYEWNHKLYLDNPVINNPIGKVDADTKFEVRINFNGCYVTDYQHVKIVDNTRIEAPTAFTPNGDGVNDEFRPLYIGISTLKYFRVFDGSGREVFVTTSPFVKWDGTYQGGEKLPVGVYKWLVSAIDRDGNEIMKSGAVLLTP